MTLDELRGFATVKDGPHMRFQPPYRQMSVTLEEADFLYALVRALKPKNVLELGTGLGLSAFFIASALQANDDDGMLWTVEPITALRREAQSLHEGLPVRHASTAAGLGRDMGLVYIDSGEQYRAQDIKTWLTNGYRGLVVVHDAERNYSDLGFGSGGLGHGIYLSTANGMWLGRSKEIL